MRLNYVLAFFFIFLIAGCKSKDAFDYNQFLVKMEEDLANDIEFTENKVQEHLNAGLYDSISVVSSKMRKIIEEKIEEIQEKTLPDVKEAANFKEAYIDFFRYMQEIYVAYENYGAQPSEDGRLQASQEMVKITARKNQVIAKLQEVQKRYAKANGFTVAK